MRGFSRENNLPDCFTNSKYRIRKQHSRMGSRIQCKSLVNKIKPKGKANNDK